MNNEEEFKDHLKNLLDSKEFEFDEANWAKASRMIDENKKKRKVWPFFLLLGIFIGSGITFLILNLHPSSTQNHPALAQNSSSAELQPSQPLVTIKDPLPSENIKTQKQNSKSQTKVSDKNEKYTDAIQTVANNKEKEKVKASNASRAFATVPSHQEETSMGVTKTEAIPPVLNANISKEEIINDPPPLAEIKEQAPAEEITKSSVNEVTKAESLPVDSKTITADKPTEMTSPAVVAVIENKTAEKTDSNLTKTILPEVYPSHILSIEAGASFLFGWKNNSTKEAMGMNPIIGLNYHNKLTDKLDYSLGLQFTTIKHLSSFSDTSKVTRYKTGEESEVTVITPQSLYYLALPFRISRDFNNKNAFGCGANFAYLITSKSNVESYHQSDQIGESTSKQETGYTEGFANYNIELSAFYRRRLYKSLSLNAEFVLGLTDLKNNAFFANTVRESSTGFKLTLLYGLIRR